MKFLGAEWVIPQGDTGFFISLSAKSQIINTLLERFQSFTTCLGYLGKSNQFITCDLVEEKILSCSQDSLSNVYPSFKC
jgi:hypothetical protein